MKRKSICLFVAMLMATASVFAQGAARKAPQISLTAEERELVEHNNDFALRLFGQARTDESLVLSPLSITYALGMLNNGATGETQQQINEVLGGASCSAETINGFCRKMLDASNTLDEKTKVLISDNIYVNTASGFHLLPDFVQTAADYYDATPESRDFGDGRTRGVINQWANDHTQGMIQEPLKEDEFDPMAISYLLNALYFKSEWTLPFDEDFTQKVYFDRGKATADMMTQFEQFRYAENDLCQSIELPYGNGAFLMTVFLPRHGKTLDDMLARMTGKEWNAMSYEPYQVSLMLPRFETDTDQNLKEIMATLGMPRAFDREDAQFDKFAVNEAQPDVPIYIDLMKQVAKIRVNESGTEAAAVTIIGMEAGSAADQKFAEFIADRPFLYVISERSTDAIFFIGQYMGEPLTNLRHDISLTEEERQLVEGNNDFSFRLFQKARGDESSIMSPLSITYALGMMNNGAAGQTQQEINEVLGSVGVGSADAINNFCRKLLSETPTLDETTTAEIANTIYVNSGLGYELQQGFVDKANEYYDAQPENRDFYDGVTWKVINQWANDHTHGMIPIVFPNEEAFDKDAGSYLFNAIYFKGAWANKFNKANTFDESFNGGETVPMMSQTEDFDYAENDLYQAVRLPYGNGAFQMTVFLPREGKTFNDVLNQIDGKSWSNGTYMKMSRESVRLMLPRFTTKTSLKLVPIMSALGMATAFSAAAEFPYFSNRPAFIGDMFQDAVIKVDEEGTEAAAITGIVVPIGIPEYVTFHANRPFFYVISEYSTGAIFFMGQYLGEGVETSIKEMEDGRLKNEDGIYDLQGRKIENSKSVNRKLTKGLYVIDGRKVIVR